MHFWKYLVIASFAVEAFGYVLLIGQQRKPITPYLAALQMAYSSFFIWVILLYWQTYAR